MKSLKLLTLMKLFSIFSFFGCSTKSADEIKKIQHGPFTIQMETKYSKSFNMNVGRRVTHSHVSYQIFYKDVPVEFAQGLQTNTGYNHLWKVYILENATKPTLIAGSQSLYLVTEENNKAVAKPIEVQGTDFASLQFLDADEGQPAMAFEVFMDDKATDVERLKGGDYLLVSHHTVLHIPDFKSYQFNKNNNDVDNYSFQSYTGAVAISPDKKWIVFPGSFQTWNTDKIPEYNNALVVYNYIQDKGYTVPIDQTKTRLQDITYINKDWLNACFEWEQDDSSVYKLKIRKLDKLPYWKGRFPEHDKVYELSPVKIEIQQVLAEFLIKELKISKENVTPGGEYTENQLKIDAGGLKFTLWYREEDKMLILLEGSGNQPGNKIYEAIINLGNAFNKELEQGKYQEYFTSF